ncbi:hypothetical protein VNO80_33838 [Phaseolus coccineus]|uniref:Uncharacterized protein n=1 Tax=Phaseolus coccineus TaxID=3886 RepID=A0AAN9KU83_PHACN
MVMTIALQELLSLGILFENSIMPHLIGLEGTLASFLSQERGNPSLTPFPFLLACISEGFLLPASGYLPIVLIKVRKLFVDSSQTFFVQFCLRVLEQLLLSLVALSLYFAQFNTLGWSTRPAGTIRSKFSVTSYSYIGEGKERSRSHLYGPRPCHEPDSNRRFPDARSGFSPF